MTQKEAQYNYVRTYGKPKPRPKLTPDAKDWLAEAKEHGIVSIKAKFTPTGQIELTAWSNEDKYLEMTEDQNREFMEFLAEWMQQFVSGNLQKIVKKTI